MNGRAFSGQSTFRIVDPSSPHASYAQALMKLALALGHHTSFAREDFLGGIECDRRIALHIDDPNNVHLRMIGEDIFVTLQSLVEICLTRHSVNYNAAFTMQAFGQDASSDQPDLIVVRANKGEAFAGRDI